MQNEDYSHALDCGFTSQGFWTENNLYSSEVYDLFLTLLYDVEDNMRMYIDQCYWDTIYDLEDGHY